MCYRGHTIDLKLDFPFEYSLIQKIEKEKKNERKKRKKWKKTEGKERKKKFLLHHQGHFTRVSCINRIW